MRRGAENNSMATTTRKTPEQLRASAVASGRMVSLSAEDERNLKEAAGRRGYALPRFNLQTARMLTAQWRSWLKLQRLGLAHIIGGGEAEELEITPAGRDALRQCRQANK